MHALGRGHNPHRDDGVMPPDRTLVLTIGLPDEDLGLEGALTAGDISFASIPQFGPLVATLAGVGASHQPVNVRYRLNAPFVLSYADCLLKDVSQLLLLQLLVNIPTLTALQLLLPVFGLEALPILNAPSLTTLSLRGELPCVYQFLSVVRAPDLDKLQVWFHRNQWDKLDTPDSPLRDHAYELALTPSAFPVLRTVQVHEVELFPRWSDVSFGCALRPLMHIPSVADVEVHLDASPLWVSDDDLLRVPVVWPELQRLVLACKRAARRAPTLDVLTHLEAACRDLVELVLPKIRLEESKFLARPGRLIDAPVGKHPLRTLRLPCQTNSTAVSTADCVDIGRQIERLFPNLVPDTEFAWITSPATVLSDWDKIWTGILDARATKYPYMMSML